MADGSTLEAGDRGLSESDVADKLIERRAARAEPPADEAPASTEETLEALEQEALGEPDTDEVEPDLELAEQEQDADDPDPDADGDEDQVTSDKFEFVDEVAEAAGMDTEEFLANIRVKTKVDGEDGEVTLAELVKGHQLESSFTRKNQQWIEQKKAETEKLESERSKLTDHFQLAVSAFEMAQQQLMSDFEGINWNELQQSNPAEWSAKRQQFGERQARLNQARQQSQQQIEQRLAQQKAEEAEATNQRLDREHKILLDKVPAWTDEKVREQEATEVAKYLSSVGFDESEISNLNDHRLVVLARAAMGQQGPSKKQLELAKKKVNETPRLVKPGTRPQSNGAITAAQKATQRAKRSGDTDDVAQALIARQKARQAKQVRRRT